MASAAGPIYGWRLVALAAAVALANRTDMAVLIYYLYAENGEYLDLQVGQLLPLSRIRSRGRQRAPTGPGQRIHLPLTKRMKAMRRVKAMMPHMVRLLCLTSSLLALCCFQHTTSRATTSQKPWLDKQLPVPERVEALLKTLTLARKIPQTYAVHTSKRLFRSF